MTKDSEVSTAPPGLATMRVEAPSLLGPVLLVFGQGILVSVCMVAVSGVWNVSSVPTVVILLSIVIPLLVATNKLTCRSTKRSVDQILSRDEDPQADVRAATELLILANLHLAPISVMTQAMGKMGRVGMTHQLWWKAEPGPVEPLTMLFEPRLLDEADVGFDELAQATAPETEPSDANPPEAPARRDDVLDTRRIHRNFRLMGWAGWIILCGLSLHVVGSGIESVQRHAMTWPFLGGLAVLLLLLFGPRQPGWFATNHWLLVPGGVLHRKAKSRDRKVTLHLFDRQRSIMTIYQQRNSGVWLLTVADAEASETTVVTDRERRLLLRAWLSPVAPPPMERLVDLS